MSKYLLYYSNINILYGKNKIINDIPGIENYKLFARWFDPNVGLHDRSNTIVFPMRVRDTNPIPLYDKNFSLSYRECANLRMQELASLHEATGKRFRLFYSGGVDSTTMFASFVDYFGLSKTRNLLEIACTKESIMENPWLWDRYIRKENFDIISAHDHTHRWSDHRIFLMGEGNDHLFGKSQFAASKKYKNQYGKVDVEKLTDHLNKFRSVSNDKKFAELFIKIGNAAPFNVLDNESLFDWWYDFSLTWNPVIYRILAQARMKQLPYDLLLVQFFNTENFQKWSLKYHDDFRERFADIDMYKFHAKEMSLSILNIPEYKSKGKFLSLPTVHGLRPSGQLIDTDLNIYSDETDYLKFVNENNDFCDL